METALIKAKSSCLSLMLQQELPFTTPYTRLLTGWQAGTKEPVTTGLRSRCPSGVEESGSQNNVFTHGSLTLLLCCSPQNPNDLCLEGCLFLYRTQLVGLLCHWIVSTVGMRGLLHQYLQAGGLKWA